MAGCSGKRTPKSVSDVVEAQDGVVCFSSIKNVEFTDLRKSI